MSKKNDDAWWMLLIAGTLGGVGLAVALMNEAERQRAPKCPKCNGVLVAGAERCEHCGTRLHWRMREAA